MVTGTSLATSLDDASKVGVADDDAEVDAEGVGSIDGDGDALDEALIDGVALGDADALDDEVDDAVDDECALALGDGDADGVLSRSASASVTASMSHRGGSPSTDAALVGASVGSPDVRA